MKLYRPRIPLDIRCIVAARQCMAGGIDIGEVVNKPAGRRLRHLLILLFKGRKHDLHHRPAIENRPSVPAYISHRGKVIPIRIYTPDANDPDHLIYLENNAENNEHYIETHVRGIGALRSDTGERNHQKAIERNRGLRSRRRKSKIAKRINPWGKGRKLRGRPFSGSAGRRHASPTVETE